MKNILNGMIVAGLFVLASTIGAFTAVGIGAVLFPNDACAAIVYRPDGRIARPEQSMFNNASIKLPAYVTITLYPLPQEEEGRACGMSYLGTTYNRVELSSDPDCQTALLHEAFHWWMYRQTERRVARLKRAYLKLRPFLVNDWRWEGETTVPYPKRPQEWIANDYEYCASLKRKEWADFKEDYKICTLLAKEIR